MRLRIHTTDAGTIVLQKWNPNHYRYEKCAGPYKNMHTAQAGKRLYEDKYVGIDFKDLQRQVMAKHWGEVNVQKVC